ncbi:rubrerythrin family protein [Pseudoflavonifractor sp. 524-17]|uniref:ferritin-like domain-containing protein n=1 Tax=Pseudoflavonifractor sp. 524-17 TaxID=2304577 RepID=UPI00137A15A0|nr:ferritin family protein [Pseudoflavonifractor sp. 524-17]NCE64263.1 rubrerythrin family protein [Pseudoflavonifractor sp. 524-17]
MERVQTGDSCRSLEPYPEVRVEGRNPRYAQAMLSNIGGVSSEMSAVSLYFYNHLITGRIETVAAVFREVSIVEMHHLKIFGELALQLGADPRLWAVQRGRQIWWSPDYIQYARKLRPLLHEAMRSERMAIQKYESQARWIQDPGIQANLRRIIEDEKIHLELFSQLCQQYAQD